MEINSIAGGLSSYTQMASGTSKLQNRREEGPGETENDHDSDDLKAAASQSDAVVVRLSSNREQENAVENSAELGEE